MRSKIFIVALLIIVVGGSAIILSYINSGRATRDVVNQSEESLYVYFYSDYCSDCSDLKQEIIPLLESTIFPAEIEWVCVDEEDGINRVMRLEVTHGLILDSLAPVLLYSGVVYAGKDQIIMKAKSI